MKIFWKFIMKPVLGESFFIKLQAFRNPQQKFSCAFYEFFRIASYQNSTGFRLCFILLNLDWKPFWQGFISILTRYFTGAGLFGLQMLITITIFHGIWTLKYLDYSLDFHCYLSYWIKTWKCLDSEFGLWLLNCTGIGLGNTWAVI